MSVNTDPPDPMCPICGKPVDIMQGLLSHHSCLFRPDDSWVKICDLSILADLRRRVEALEKAFGVAMQDAMRVIETVGTTGADSAENYRRAEAWLKTYFPERV